MGSITILDDTTPKNPITIIGRRAGICWGADVSDDEKNYKRGLSCLKDNHGRTFEFVCVDMVIDGYSARVIREWYTHIGGSPTRLQASTRYINYENIEHITPLSIKLNEKARDIYESLYGKISDAYKSLIDLGILKEDVANILPLGMTTTIVDHRNLRNLIDFEDKISVIIPTYNRAKSIIHSIKSVLTQTYHNLEVIIIDLVLLSLDHGIETTNRVSLKPSHRTTSI